MQQEFQDYLNRHYKNEKTKHQYASCMRKYLNNISTVIDQKAIDDFNRKYKPTIINQTFLKHLIECFEIKNIKLPKQRDKNQNIQKRKQYKFLTPEQIKLMIKKLPFELSIKVSLLYDTGMRLDELMQLQRKNIDLQNNKLYGIGKGNKEFELLFSNLTKEGLKLYLRVYKSETPFKDSRLKHPGKKFWRELKMECDKLEIHPPNTKGVHPHMIRHSLGHNLRVHQGFDLEQIREQLRHEDITTTSIYATATKEEVQRKMKEVFDKNERANNNI